jgi:hypothetical protein
MSTAFDSIFTDAGARAVNPGANRIIQPASAAPQTVDPNRVRAQVTDTRGMSAEQAAAARRADFAATVAVVEAAASGKPAPKAKEPELTPEAKIAAWDASQRATGAQLPQQFADVPDNYQPEKPPAYPGVDASHNEKMAYIHGETLRMQRIFSGTERPRTQNELNNTNAQRAQAGLLPIVAVPRKGIDPKAYGGDLIAAGVLVPVLGAPAQDTSRGNPALLKRGTDYMSRPDLTPEERKHGERYLAAVAEGLKLGEKEDDFRARMLKTGTAEQKARWSDADAINVWSAAAQKKAMALNDPRLSTLVHLATSHVHNGLRIAELQSTRDDLDQFLAAVEKGDATWTAELDAEVAAMRAANFRREQGERLRFELAKDLSERAGVKIEIGHEAAKALAGKIDTQGCTAVENVPATLLYGYSLALIPNGTEIDIAGTLGELATARELNATQAQIDKHLRQRFGIKAA